MTEQDAYQELLKVMEKGYGKVDPKIVTMLKECVALGRDVNLFAVPMLALIRESGIDLVRKHAFVLGTIGRYASLLATPAQLLELIKMDEVISLDASESGGDFNN